MSREGGPPPGEPRVSCVVPARDSHRYIGDCLESVLGQTHPPLEVIVVDDSAGDETARIARELGEPIRLIRGESRGPAAARNLGLSQARGDLIGFNDADDIWLPDKLAKQVALLEARPDLGGCVTQVEMFWEDDVAWEEEALRGTERGGIVPGWASIALLARREAFERIGPLDENRTFSDAVEWFMRAREAGLPIELIEEPLVRHRRRPGSLSREQGANQEFLGLLRETIRRRRGEGAG